MGVFGKIKDSTKKGLVKGKEATVDKTRERREQKRQEEEEIAKIRLISITKKWSDEACNELGYQFVLNCDICNSEYKTRYVESSAATKGDRLKRIAHGTSAGLSIANKVNPANIIKRGDGEDKSGEKAGGFFNEWSNIYQKYGPAWQKDYAKELLLHRQRQRNTINNAQNADCGYVLTVGMYQENYVSMMPRNWRFVTNVIKLQVLETFAKNVVRLRN